MKNGETIEVVGGGPGQSHVRPTCETKVNLEKVLRSLYIYVMPSDSSNKPNKKQLRAAAAATASAARAAAAASTAARQVVRSGKPGPQGRGGASNQTESQKLARKAMKQALQLKTLGALQSSKVVKRMYDHVNSLNIANEVKEVLLSWMLPLDVRPVIPPLTTSRPVARTNPFYFAKTAWDVSETNNGTKDVLPFTQMAVIATRWPLCPFIVYDANASAATAARAAVDEGGHTAMEVEVGSWPEFFGSQCSGNPFSTNEAAWIDEDGVSYVWTDNFSTNAAGGTAGAATTLVVSGLPASASCTYILRQWCCNVITETQATATSTAGGQLTITYTTSMYGLSTIKFIVETGVVASLLSYTWNMKSGFFWPCQPQGLNKVASALDSILPISQCVQLAQAAAPQYTEGEIVAFRGGSGSHWTEFFFNATGTAPLTDPFTNLASTTGSLKIKAENGCYAWLKPQDRNVADWTPIQAVSGATSIVGPQQSIEMDDYVVVIMTTTYSAAIGGLNRDSYWILGQGLLSKTDVTYIPVESPNIPPAIYDEAAFVAGLAPWFGENPTHFGDILDWVQRIGNTIAQLAPVASMGAMLIPGGQAAAPFISGLGTAGSAFGTAAGIMSGSQGNIAPKKKMK
jgi:hypothetical protein